MTTEEFIETLRTIVQKHDEQSEVEFRQLNEIILWRKYFVHLYSEYFTINMENKFIHETSCADMILQGPEEMLRILYSEEYQETP